MASWDFPGERPLSEDPRGHNESGPWFPRGWGSHQKGRWVRGRMGVVVLEDSPEAKHLGPSAQALAWSPMHEARLRQVTRRLLEGPGIQGGRGEPGGLGRLTLLQLDVAAAFDLGDPAVVNGPGGLWNRCSLAQGLWASAAAGRSPSPSPCHGPPPPNRREPFSGCDSDTCDPRDACVLGPRGQGQVLAG